MATAAAAADTAAPPSGAAERAAALVAFLRSHEWLWGIHLVDFFAVSAASAVPRLRSVERSHCFLLACFAGFCHYNLFLRVQDGGQEFRQRYWEKLDPAWLPHLRHVPVCHLLLMPEGTSESTTLGTVLSQGMTPKKRHEAERLAKVVADLARSSGANCVIDLGAGQGHLAQVLTFRHKLRVDALDAVAAYADVTCARAARVAKHLICERREGVDSGAVSLVSAPTAVPLHIPTDTGTATLASFLSSLRLADCPEGCNPALLTVSRSRALLVGLHACGDLSPTMLLTFLALPEVAAVVSVGCCYNLLSEQEFVAEFNDGDQVAGILGRQELTTVGYPMSRCMGDARLHIGRSGRDLACQDFAYRTHQSVHPPWQQSAERWRALQDDEAQCNFFVHACRAALQLVLQRWYPVVAAVRPVVGRQGKAARRRRLALQRQQGLPPALPMSSPNADTCKSRESDQDAADLCSEDDDQMAMDFVAYVQAALERLGLPMVPVEDLHQTWLEVAPHQWLVGVMWALRAVLASPLESLILLDRLLFLEEAAAAVGHNARAEDVGAGVVTSSRLVPVFDPSLSPRNMALIATKDV
eukprot:SM000075S21960  [mRNA]  locus=s75:206421:209905:- [translate_table: standard]